MRIQSVSFFFHVIHQKISNLKGPNKYVNFFLHAKDKNYLMKSLVDCSTQKGLILKSNLSSFFLFSLIRGGTEFHIFSLSRKYMLF